ncbi:S9 family peptidase [Flavobacterium zepuense]|uniref:S9 family peptidase n=1 Tax=Flavobacterium zepuense TaxID=2593302 RepID=A0A552UZH1_9FLAO|nr:prolyl oligopeptidase family serine peptidase [Flavobacterium zepuense]TRW23624.1 S9 family peptidase [Flavobacterium zepuense]
MENTIYRCNHSALKLSCFLVCLLLLITCPVVGQVINAKPITREDYHLWGSPELKEVSDDGKWISYSVSYENGADTLFVKGSENATAYSFPQHNNGTFTSSGYFACQRENKLVVMDLNGGLIKSYDDIKSFEFSKKAGMLILLSNGNGTNSLRLTDQQGKTIYSLKDVSSYALAPTGTKLAYTTSEGKKSILGVLKLGHRIENIVIASSSIYSYSDFVWHTTGVAFSFYIIDASAPVGIGYYILSDKKLYQLDQATNKNLWPQTGIVKDWVYKLTISPDMKNVFFATQKTNHNSETLNQLAEVWAADDKYVYPQRQKAGNAIGAKLSVWKPGEKSFKVLESDTLTWNMAAGNYNYLVSANPLKYEPQFKYSAPMDFYIKDMQKGTTKLLLSKHSAYPFHINASPSGKYVVYFSDGDWYLYSMLSGLHNNITAHLNSNFRNERNVIGGEIEACGIAGWSGDDESLFLYDNFDIWEYRPRSGYIKRITHGKEMNVQFRAIAENNRAGLIRNFNGYYSPIISTNKNMLLKATGENGNTGYFLWSRRYGVKKLIYGDSFIDQGKIINGGIVYREQRFNLPPRLMLKDSTHSPQCIFQSNSHHRKYEWGFSELIQYTNSKGDALKGNLWYPAGFRKGQKYPMIVHIYQRQSQDFNLYPVPMLYQPVGFDPLMFLSDGYFILYPDITNDIDNPGTAANEWVTSAVRKVLATGMVDSDEIGLIGHSFGGYETDFIIGQTNIFKAAVAGGAITDLQSYYLGINWDSGKPDSWRLEDQQWHMSKSLFDDRDSYYSNSPINYAEKIQTPLLSWSGKNDNQVNWHQSVELYLALRRLGRKHVMLLYPNEGHNLQSPSNQEDLCQKTKEWFDYFLKGDKNIEWIKESTE